MAYKQQTTQTSVALSAGTPVAIVVPTDDNRTGGGAGPGLPEQCKISIKNTGSNAIYVVKAGQTTASTLEIAAGDTYLAGPYLFPGGMPEILNVSGGSTCDYDVIGLGGEF